MPKVRTWWGVLCLLVGFIEPTLAKGNDELEEVRLSKAKVREATQRLRKEPANAQAYADRAAARLQLGNASAAIRDYTAAIKLAPEKTCYLQSRGEVYAQIAAFKQALSDFNAAFSVQPSLELAFDRALAQFYLGEYEAAIQDLNQVLELEPQNSVALYCRGMVKLEMRALESAIQDFDELLKQEPHHLEALYARGLAQRKLEKQIAKRIILPALFSL